MSTDVAAIVERARLAAQKPASASDGAADREQLKRIAAEFESMLLVQVLKDMRQAGSWDEEGAGDSLGAESLFETLDVELATHLAKVKGMGLGKQLEEAVDRAAGVVATPNSQTPTSKNADVAAAGAQSVLGVGSRTSAVDAGPSTVVHTRKAGPVETVQQRVPDVATLVKTAAKKTAAAVERTAEKTTDVVEKTPAALGHMLKPVAGAVTSAFGWRRHPITHEVKFHQGVDLRAAYGQEVQSAAAGKVVFSGDQGAYGATVVLEHADGTQTRYAHLSARLVKKGDAVGAGDPIGRAGKSGRATGTHLHFEVIAPNGQRVEPQQWAGGRQAPLAQAASADHAHGPSAGKPPVVTAGRSIKDRSTGAD